MVAVIIIDIKIKRLEPKVTIAYVLMPAPLPAKVLSNPMRVPSPIDLPHNKHYDSINTL